MPISPSLVCVFFPLENSACWLEAHCMRTFNLDPPFYTPTIHFRPHIKPNLTNLWDIFYSFCCRHHFLQMGFGWGCALRDPPSDPLVTPLVTPRAINTVPLGLGFSTVPMCKLFPLMSRIFLKKMGKFCESSKKILRLMCMSYQQGFSEMHNQHIFNFTANIFSLGDTKKFRISTPLISFFWENCFAL